MSDNIFLDEGKVEEPTPEEIRRMEREVTNPEVSVDKYKKQIAKYYDNQFDIDFDPQTEEMVRMMAACGAGIPIKYLSD